jgi:hypothetical protein
MLGSCLAQVRCRMRSGFVPIALIAVCGCVRAGSLRAVLEVNLREAIQGRGVAHDPDLPVWTLKFSPDGKQLAVVADQWLLESRTTRAPYRDLSNRVFVIQVDRPGMTPSWYDTECCATWSPSGRLVHFGRTTVWLGDGKRCVVPPEYQAADGSFLSEDRLVFDVATAASDRAGGDTVGVFGTDCGLREKWTVPGTWAIADVSSDRGLLMFYPKVGSPSEVVVVDPATRGVLQRWPKEATWEGWTVQLMVGAVFADSGKAVCGGSEAETKKLPVSCWDVDTGRKIADAPRVRGGVPISAAVRSTRIMVADYRRVRESLFSSEFGEKLRRMVVWDFRSGQEVLSWQPGYQSYHDLVTDPPRFTKERCPSSISPDGHFIAEGCNGILRMFEIQP